MATTSMAATWLEMLCKLMLDKSVPDPFSISIHPCTWHSYTDDVNFTVWPAPTAGGLPLSTYRWSGFNGEWGLKTLERVENRGI